MSDVGRTINENDGTPRGCIYQGDKTSHGGVVIGATGSSAKGDGKMIARLGDITYCPKCKPHIFPISTADSKFLNYDIPVPRHNDLTACGAKLLAERASADEIAAADAMVNAEKYPYDEQFQAIDKTTGKPLSDIAYFIEREDGITFFGETDAEGKCPRIGSEDAKNLKAWFGLSALVKQHGGTGNDSYDEQLQAIDEATGRPLKGIAYFIEKEGGLTFYGETDEEGKCPRIHSEGAKSIKAWFGVSALIKQYGK